MLHLTAWHQYNPPIPPLCSDRPGSIVTLSNDSFTTPSSPIRSKRFAIRSFFSL